MKNTKDFPEAAIKVGYMETEERTTKGPIPETSSFAKIDYRSMYIGRTKRPLMYEGWSNKKPKLQAEKTEINEITGMMEKTLQIGPTK